MRRLNSAKLRLMLSDSVTILLAAAKQWANIPLKASLLFNCDVIPARIAGGLVYEPPGATVGLDLYDTEKDGRIESAG